MLSVRAWISDVDWAEYRRAMLALVPMVFAAATVGWTVGEVTDQPPHPPRPSGVAGIGAVTQQTGQPGPDTPPQPVADGRWPAGQPRQPVAWWPTQAPVGAQQEGVDEAVEHDGTADIKPTPDGSTPTPDQPEPTLPASGSPEPRPDPEPSGEPAEQQPDDGQTGAPDVPPSPM